MIDKRTVFEIHRLKDMGFSARQIARSLNLDRDTVKKYVHDPDIKSNSRSERPSKLDPFRGLIKDMVAQYPKVKAPVVLRQIQDKGFNGEITIIRDYLRHLKEGSCQEPFIRFESLPGNFLVDRNMTAGEKSRPIGLQVCRHICQLRVVHKTTGKN